MLTLDQAKEATRKLAIEAGPATDDAGVFTIDDCYLYYASVLSVFQDGITHLTANEGATLQCRGSVAVGGVTYHLAVLT